ncbi:MAG: Glycerophosphodiester phosphodiesterase, cytoplasmic [Burkholderiaceae bacterium]|nr:Glycerophosphodiester phosphodiesterase, cytoplasmic [Burkholderiaceae bacterium]
MAPWPFPLWIAHRGAGKLAPENTLAAFRLGAAHGHTAFECDVKLSADGVPFLLHDDTLERTTTGRGVAGERAWAELSRLDAGGWHSAAYAGEPIASFEAIAAFCCANGHALDLEIKPSPSTDIETGRAVGQWVRKLWRGAPLLLSSFKPQALMGARETAPELPRALLLDTLWPGCIEMAASLQCVAIVTNHKLMDAALCAQVHAAGRRALVYTVNDAARARELVALGIDGIVTDAVDVFSPRLPLP